MATGSRFERRRAAPLLRRGGLTLAAGGALAVLVGAALPWARVTVFGVALALPGLAWWGAATAAGAMLALARQRAWPLVGVAVGLGCLWAGMQARQTVGKTLAREALRVQVTLAPVNDRLARVGLSPVEPFASLGPADSYVGPGPGWTVWGGAALALGAAAAFAGARLRRTCVSCGTLWAEGRLPDLHFCPRCGVRADDLPLCPTCHRPRRAGDRFCITCGTPAPPR